MKYPEDIDRDRRNAKLAHALNRIMFHSRKAEFAEPSEEELVEYRKHVELAGVEYDPFLKAFVPAEV